MKVALTSFPNVKLAVAAVVEILAAGLSPTSLELLDGMSIRGLNLAKLLPEELEERPTVLMRFSSPLEQVLNLALERVEEIVLRHGAESLRVAKDEVENEEIWKARKNQFWSQQLLIGEGCRTLVSNLTLLSFSHFLRFVTGIFVVVAFRRLEVSTNALVLIFSFVDYRCLCTN